MNPVTRLPHVAPPDGIPSIEVANRAEITYRMLDHWVRAGYVRCAHNPQPGCGYQRSWTPAEAAHVIRMAELVRAGFRVDYAAAYASQLAERETVRIGHGLTVCEATA
jgi:DNA-binding transcriptional MerR regulator